MSLEEKLSHEETRASLLRAILKYQIKPHERSGFPDRYVINATGGFYAIYHFKDPPIELEQEEWVMLYIPYAEGYEARVIQS